MWIYDSNGEKGLIGQTFVQANTVYHPAPKYWSIPVLYEKRIRVAWSNSNMDFG